MATDDILRITDGTTTLDLLRGPVRLAQDGWAPALPRRRDSDLGGTSLWEPTEETLSLQTIASLTDNPGRTWSELQRLLDQAARWYEGDDSAAPVRLEVRPAGSRLAGGQYLRAPLYGGQLEALHASYTRMLEADVAAPVDVRLTRGMWRATTAVTGSASVGTAQQIMTVTLATAPPVRSPINLSIVPQVQVHSAGDANGVRGVILVGEGSTPSTAFLAANAGTGVGWATVGEVGALEAAVTRVTPGGDTVCSSTNLSSVFGTATPYLVARANSGGVFRVRLRFSNATFLAIGNTYYTEWMTIQGTTALPYAFLPVASGFSHTAVVFEVESLSGGGTLDIDTLWLHLDQGPASYAIRLAEPAVNVATAASVGFTVLTIFQNPFAFSSVTPGPKGVYGRPHVEIGQVSSGAPFVRTATRQVGYLGDAAIHMEQKIFVLPLLTGGIDATKLAVTNRAVSALATFQVQVERWDTYLIPE
jgi:hypothetical protein